MEFTPGLSYCALYSLLAPCGLAVRGGRRGLRKRRGERGRLWGAIGPCTVTSFPDLPPRSEVLGEEESPGRLRRRAAILGCRMSWQNPGVEVRAHFGTQNWSEGCALKGQGGPRA